MMNDIDVFIYSYKGRIIKDVLRSLFNNASGENKINVAFMDQNPIDRGVQLSEEFPINYRFMFWDFQKSPIFHKRKALIHSSAQYFMSLSDNVLMSKDWDKKLISLCKDKNIIISGSGKKTLQIRNNFYLDIETEHSDSETLTHIIDRDFIFAHGSVFKKLDYPVYLKYNGEQEVLSLDAYTSGIDVYSAPTSLSSTASERTIEKLYVPFSVNHNYNSALTALQTGFNKYKDFNNRSRSLKDFENAVNINFTDLSFLPFLTDDVAYNPENLDFNSVDARRFVARTKSIH